MLCHYHINEFTFSRMVLIGSVYLHTSHLVAEPVVTKRSWYPKTMLKHFHTLWIVIAWLQPVNCCYTGRLCQWMASCYSYPNFERIRIPWICQFVVKTSFDFSIAQIVDAKLMVVKSSHGTITIVTIVSIFFFTCTCAYIATLKNWG